MTLLGLIGILCITLVFIFWLGTGREILFYHEKGDFVDWETFRRGFKPFGIVAVLVVLGYLASQVRIY